MKCRLPPKGPPPPTPSIPQLSSPPTPVPLCWHPLMPGSSCAVEQFGLLLLHPFIFLVSPSALISGTVISFSQSASQPRRFSHSCLSIIHVASSGLFRFICNVLSRLSYTPTRAVSSSVLHLTSLALSLFALPFSSFSRPSSNSAAFPGLCHISPFYAPLLGPKRMPCPILFHDGRFLEFFAHIPWGVVLSRPNRLIDKLAHRVTLFPRSLRVPVITRPPYLL